MREGLARYAPRGVRREMRKPRIVPLEERFGESADDTSDSTLLKAAAS